MCKKLIYVVCFVLTISQAGNAAEVARWDFEETGGATATDGIGGYVATLQGGASLNIDGKFGSGLNCVGNGGAVVDLVGSKAVRFPGDFSVAVWINPNTAMGNFTRFIDTSSTTGGLEDGYRIHTRSGDTADNFRFLAQGTARVEVWHTRDIALNTWTLLVLRYDADGDATLNSLHEGDVVDAAFVASNSESVPAVGSLDYADGRLMFGQSPSGNFFDGQLDGAVFYDDVLTDAQVVDIFYIAPPASKSIAYSPNPADEATDVPRDDVVLSWRPDELSVSHDVYFGKSFEDVNTATTASDEYKGNQIETTYALDRRLEFSQTHYWRIDEVNDAGPNSPWKGDVWSFTVEPIAYPIADVNATASSSNSAEEGPENTVNASGLDADDLHSDDSKAMWLSSAIGPQPTWIQYEFNRVYKLYEMWVWNYNTSDEPLVGSGIREATIECSADGTNWATLATVEFAQGPGIAGYTSNTTVDLGGVAAKYVKITGKSNWGGTFSQYGLSEVRFLSIPVWAREPDPVSGATDVDVDATQSWRAGREAIRHDVYLGTDEQAVRDGTVPVDTVTEPNYASSLDLASTYYWRIDEVNNVETPTTWQGDIWSFSTRESLVVDDFDSYNEIPFGEEGSNLVYNTWIDGYVEPPAVRTNGSTMGYTVAFQPSMETSLVYDGQKSAPLIYDNTTATYSEVTADIAKLQVVQDWTKHGIKALTLRFFGDSNNVAQQMYVKLNDEKVLYDGDAENLTRLGWQTWTIDLSGMALSNVTKISIGVERIGALGGQGRILLDDIRLTPFARELITPTEPDAAFLVGQWPFEGDLADISGHGHNGTAMGGPVFEPGKDGQAITLDGYVDYVVITGYQGIVADRTDPNNPVQPAFSISCWIKTSRSADIMGWGKNAGGERVEFRINADRLRCQNGAGSVQGDSNVTDGEWHHVALTVIENATISSSDTVLYVDGKDDTRFSTDSDTFNITADQDVKIGRRFDRDGRFFEGQIDDVRIYGYALSAGEVASLAGRILPFDKP